MLELIYAPIFVREFKKLEISLQAEVLEKVELFKNPLNHQRLKVHKLRGPLRGCYSFSINYKFRIIFSYSFSNKVNILAIGDHDVYN